MRSVVRTFAFLSLASIAHSESNQLEGVWTVDENSTLEFNLKQKAYTSAAVALMKCMAKSSFLIFSKDVMKYVMASHQCEANGKSSRVDGYETSVTYRVLASSVASVAIATKSEDGEEYFDVLRFENDDTFWIYAPGEPPEYQDHMRIYYVRKHK